MAQTQNQTSDNVEIYARLVGGDIYRIPAIENPNKIGKHAFNGEGFAFTRQDGWVKVSSKLADYLQETAFDMETSSISGRRQKTRKICKFEFAEMTAAEAAQENRELRLKEQRGGDMDVEEVQDQPRTRTRRRGPGRSS